jgi:hypothetical protein
MEKTPFEADLGYTPWILLDIITATTSAGSYRDMGSRPGAQQAVNFATTMSEILAQLRDMLAITQAAQAAEANKK